jgi:hypothetical protein
MGIKKGVSSSPFQVHSPSIEIQMVLEMSVQLKDGKTDNSNVETVWIIILQ